jgi:hypothetical protein
MSPVILKLILSMSKQMFCLYIFTKSRPFSNFALRYRKHTLVICKFFGNYRSFTRVNLPEEQPWCDVI